MTTPTLSKKQATFVDWTIDLLIYIVILNLFAEYSSAFYFDTFTITIFTAVVLKGLLKVIISLEHKVSHFFKQKEGEIYRYLNIIIAFLILFLSKFLILEVIDIIFGPRVEIYGFIPLVVLIITMIVTRKILELIYNKL